MRNWCAWADHTLVCVWAVGVASAESGFDRVKKGRVWLLPDLPDPLCSPLTAIHSFTHSPVHAGDVLVRKTDKF